MKRLLAILTLTMGLASYHAEAAQTYVPKEKKVQKAKKQKDTSSVKTGFSWSALPGVSYSTDQGFQVGAFGHFYWHGDGRYYPQPIHDIGWEVSWFTHGRTRAYVSYDSKFIIPKTRFNGSVTYVNDPMYNFFGFNGAAQKYDRKKGAAQNGMHRDMVRVLADFQGEILPNFKWAAGLAYWGFWTKPMQGRFFNKYCTDEQGNADDRTFYTQYVNAGLIRENEKNGGHCMEFKAGLVYDSRDQEAAPNKGIWAELYTYGSPNMLGSGYNYMKLAAHFRHFVSFPWKWKGGGIVFAYHLAYQGTIAGEAPYYIQQNVNTLILRQMISEGLGSSNTVRGLAGNRIIADGVVWANVDLRIKLVSFKLWKQFFYIGLCPFYDMGMVVQPYRMLEHYDYMRTLEPDLSIESYKKMVYTPVHNIGIGAKVGWNENFIGSVEVAKCLNQKERGMDDGLWISIGVGYAF